MSSYHWFSRLYCTKWLHSLKTTLHPLSNDCSASPDFTTSGLVGQYWCQMLSAMCLCIFTRRRHLKKNNKRALQSARWLTMLKPVDAILTHAYIPSPTGVKCVNPTAIALKKLVSLASIRLRGTEMAANRKRHSYCDVTTIRQTRHFRFWRRQISRWRRRWFRQTEGDRFLPSTSFFQCMHPVRGNVVIMYTHRTTVLILYSGLCDIRVLFYVRCRFTCVAYSTG